ncbi:hypothetical protein Cni_G04360 [Canna indica]|uniref:Nucleobase-ascorbate transporter 2 n=1 Tax=Canna indica TaxID=4628 RepID=A0AAQ3JUK0_9LILI|nr:hypothetical protein Cni_G04360 [Canna indica]
MDMDQRDLAPALAQLRLDASLHPCAPPDPNPHPTPVSDAFPALRSARSTAFKREERRKHRERRRQRKLQQQRLAPLLSQRRSLDPNAPDIPWPCEPLVPPSTSWSSRPTPAAVPPPTEHELRAAAAGLAQRNALRSTLAFFSRDDGSDADEEDSTEEEGAFLAFFTELFEKDCELRDYYKGNHEKGEFRCLVCGGIREKAWRRFDSCAALVHHSTAVSRTKKRHAHREFAVAVCRLLGWDADELLPRPSLALEDPLVDMDNVTESMESVEEEGTLLVDPVYRPIPIANATPPAAPSFCLAFVLRYGCALLLIALGFPPFLEMTEFKPEEASHPPTDQLQGFEYCIDSNPPWGEAIILGFQHYILSLGSTVMTPTLLVPLMGGSNDDKIRVIQSLLFVTGINTLLQTLFGSRLPTVVGGSYAFVVPIISIIHDSSLMRVTDDHERFLQTMRAIQGALIVSSSIQIILGYSQLWGIFSRFFSPLGMVPVVALVGFGLFDRGFPVVGQCVEIGVPMLILFIATSQQYLKHLQVRRLPIIERFSLLISVIIIWAYAHLLTASGAYRHRSELTQVNCRTDRARLISSAPWYLIKIPYPLQWGAPTFDAGHSFGMMAAVFVSLVESTAAYKAAARLSSATPPPAHILSRGIGWQGIGILLDGLFGTGTGSTVLVENVGLLGSTRVGSRRVVQISGGFMIFFSILGKFGALFASIPFTIFAAIYCVLFGLVAAVGLSFLQFTNMNSMRNLFIVGVSIFLGLSIPEYFFRYTSLAHRGPSHTKAQWFNDYINTIFSSPPTVALIVAVFLDNTLELKDSARDRGMPWWVRFRAFKGDSRNEEFYNLPFNLNRFFPPT